jgi:hypothetical protein
MRDIEVQVEGKFQRAIRARLNRTLPLSAAGAYTKFLTAPISKRTMPSCWSTEGPERNICFRSSCDGWTSVLADLECSVRSEWPAPSPDHRI